MLTGDELPDDLYSALRVVAEHAMARIGEADKMQQAGRNTARDIGGIFNRSNGVVLTGQEQSRAFNPIEVFQQWVPGRFGRVASGDCSPEAPTDPDMRIFRIRLLGPRLRYVAGEWM